MAWPGGKDGSGVVQRLINQIPPHDVFVSAFLGDCAILRRKLPATLTIGIDLDRENIARWADRADEFDGGLRLFCCDAIEWLRHRFDLDLVGPPQTAAGDRSFQPPNSAARTGGGKSEQEATEKTERGKAMHPPLPLLPPVHLPAAAAAGNGGSSWLLSPGPCPLRTFVYLDPPYLLDSRRSQKQLYAHELSRGEHESLLDVVVALPCDVMVSHYPHSLYAERLAAWRTFTFSSVTRSGKRATEQVWCNYSAPIELHDARYVGGNKRERERVRRRVRNWLGGLARMEQAERQAILDAIEGRYFSSGQ